MRFVNDNAMAVIATTINVCYNKIDLVAMYWEKTLQIEML